MDSIKRADSSLSISSIVFDSNPSSDDPEIRTKSNSMLKLLLEAIADTNVENSALGNEILKLLNILNIDTKSLPSDIREELQTASAILKSEGLPVVEETALQLCLEKKKIQNKMKEREERLLKAKYNAAFAKYNALQEKLNHIRKAVEEIEDKLQLKMSNDENIESDRILWSHRLHDYRDTIKKMEQELDSLQIKEIGIDNTLQKSSLLFNKLNDLNKLNNSLQRYGDLPPNLLQAKNLLECKTQELQEIENLMYNKMNE